MKGPAWWDALQASPAHIVARVRAAVIGFSLLGAGFAQDAADATGWARLAPIIRVLMGLAIVAAASMRAGEKNEQ